MPERGFQPCAVVKLRRDWTSLWEALPEVCWCCSWLLFVEMSSESRGPDRPSLRHWGIFCHLQPTERKVRRHEVRLTGDRLFLTRAYFCAVLLMSQAGLQSLVLVNNKIATSGQAFEI
jgi:hypothetical protein